MDKLIDIRNKELWREINESVVCNVEYVNHVEHYGCYTIGNKATIYVPFNNLMADSFTHELLHIKMTTIDVRIGVHFKLMTRSNPVLSKIYSEGLCEQIGNSMDHVKMLPIYLEMGFDRSKFLFDYFDHKFTVSEIEMIQANWRTGSIANNKAIDYYIGKLFGAFSDPNSDHTYNGEFEMLKDIDQELFLINELLFNQWRNFDIEESEDPEHHLIMISESYFNAMTEWCLNMNIE